jgi:hypothetical protein
LAVLRAPFFAVDLRAVFFAPVRLAVLRAPFFAADLRAVFFAVERLAVLRAPFFAVDLRAAGRFTADLRPVLRFAVLRAPFFAAVRFVAFFAAAPRVEARRAVTFLAAAFFRGAFFAAAPFAALRVDFFDFAAPWVLRRVAMWTPCFGGRVDIPSGVRFDVSDPLRLRLPPSYCTVFRNRHPRRTTPF